MYSMITIGILLLFGMIGLNAYLVGTYNTFVRLSNNIDKSWSTTMSSSNSGTMNFRNWSTSVPVT